MNPLSEALQKLQQDLVDANSMVMRAMGTSSDLGLVVQFLKKSFGIHNYRDLGEELVRQLSTIGLTSCVWIKTLEGYIFCDLGDSEGMVNEVFIQKHINSGRIYQYRSLTQINYENVSLLITNFPTDKFRQGELRDSLVILLDGVEARIRALLMERELEESRKVKDEFFRLMSLKLKTPLNPIMGFTDVLVKRLKDDLSKKDLNALKKIQHSGNELLEIINELLDLSKKQDGKGLSLIKGPVDISRVVRNICEEQKPYAKQQNTELVFNNRATEKSENLNFDLDSVRFSEILRKLIVNGIKYSPEGEVQVILEINTMEPIGEHLVLLISDTGTGIGKEEQKGIFKINNEREYMEAEGMCCHLNISLATVKAVVNLHGGSIELLSEPGNGSTFKIVIPRNLNSAQH